MTKDMLLRVTRPVPSLHAMVDKDRSTARCALPLAALQGVWQAAPDALSHIGSVRHVNGLLLIATVTWLPLKGHGGRHTR